jgi:hypothetical protein
VPHALFPLGLAWPNKALEALALEVYRKPKALQQFLIFSCTKLEVRTNFFDLFERSMFLWSRKRTVSFMKESLLYERHRLCSQGMTSIVKE